MKILFKGLLEGLVLFHYHLGHRDIFHSHSHGLKDRYSLGGLAFRSQQDFSNDSCNFIENPDQFCSSTGVVVGIQLAARVDIRIQFRVMVLTRADCCRRRD